MSDLIHALHDAVGARHVWTDPDRMAPHLREGRGRWQGEALAVVHPASTAEVAACVRACAAAGVAIYPQGGNTGLVGGGIPQGGVVIATGRMNRIREVDPLNATITVEAGCTLAAIQQAADEADRLFPLSLASEGSCQIGGNLSTNAGGTGVLRYGNTRDLALGVEVVLPDGQVLNALSALRKDNTGYDLRDLFIGAEGTLGLITAATLALVPAPRAYVTALIGMETSDAALDVLHELQSATNGSVEAFEYMPQGYTDRLTDQRPDLAPPFRHGANILIEAAGSDEPALRAALETVLEHGFEAGQITDAVIAESGAQRDRLWAMREAAAEITLNRHPLVDTDIALPLDRVGAFLGKMQERLAALDARAQEMVVAHLGDGNIHYTAYPSRDDPALMAAIRAAVSELAVSMGGTFSAEHGIGLSKRPSMAAHKDPVALEVMRTIKAALDPLGIMNPGKVLPD